MSEIVHTQPIPAPAPALPPSALPPSALAAPGPIREFWYYFRQNPGSVAGLIVVAIMALLAIFASLVAPHDPIEQFRDFQLLPPAWLEGGSWRFPFGTDDLGRDMLSRLIFGARLSLEVGAVVVSISLVIGTLLGLLAGYVGGTPDVLIMRIMDIMLALPSLLLAIVIVAILGPSLFNAMLAVAVTMLPHFVRLTRASVLAEKTRDYVVASRVAGAGTLRLMFLAILPNCLAPLVVQATLGYSSAIIDAAALGFLGLGAQPPTPEWGAMLSGALQFIQQAWWVVTLPGLAIFVTVLAFNLMGDGIRDALDPKLKR
jgi:dipeptide transport system permease protein